MQRNIKSKYIEDLLYEGKRLLATISNAFPSLDAALLLAEASGLSREELITHNDYELDEEQCRRFFDFLERRLGGESTAYILGRKEFFGLELSVTPAVLVPRPETEILVEAALAILRRAPSSPLPVSRLAMLDLCTGSGNIAIALKHQCPDLEVWAADISEEALIIARRNAEALDCKINFLISDLFNCFQGKKQKSSNSLHERLQFSLITANAPYIQSKEIPLLMAEVRCEPRIALDGGKDGLDLIRRIITEAPLYLEAGGSLVLEADPSQMETIAALMTDNGFSDPALYKDLAGNNRVIAAAIPV